MVRNYGVQILWVNTVYDAQHGEKALMACANSKCPGERVHSCSLIYISLFVNIY